MVAQSTIRETQRGQVLVIGLFVVVGLTMLAITVANVGIMVSERIRAQDTVDSAAYSAAVMEARYMNLNAYISRAIVANYNSMAFNTALWAMMDADDHGIAVVTGLLYQLSGILVLTGFLAPFGEAVDVVAEGFSAVHTALHELNYLLDDMFAQDNKDLNKYIEMFNKDVLTMLEGVLYGATQSARHQIIQGVADEMNPNLSTSSVLGLGAETLNYDELAKAVDWVIRDTKIRGNPARALNESFDKMFGHNSDEENVLYLGAVTEASLDNFVAGRSRTGENDLLRQFNTGNIASSATDALEIFLDGLCYASCLPGCIFDPGDCCDCNAQVEILLGAAIRDGFENKHNETHVPFISRERMREVNFFGLTLRVNQIPGASKINALLGDNGHTSGEKRNDIANEANSSFALEEWPTFSFERMFECQQTGSCKLNDMNIFESKTMLPFGLPTYLYDDDHWDGAFNGIRPVCSWEMIPPAVCMSTHAKDYLAKFYFNPSQVTEQGVPKYDWQVDLDNLGFANYQYPEDGSQKRPHGTSGGDSDDALIGPSIGVVGVKPASKIGGLRGLKLGNEYPISVISRAQVYYLRNPNRPDEKPSAFNPHWVPRLAPIDSDDTPVLLRKLLPFVSSMGAPIDLTH